jgi:hypothetical protein
MACSQRQRDDRAFLSQQQRNRVKVSSSPTKARLGKLETAYYLNLCRPVKKDSDGWYIRTDEAVRDVAGIIRRYGVREVRHAVRAGVVPPPVVVAAA